MRNIAPRTRSDDPTRAWTMPSPSARVECRAPGHGRGVRVVQPPVEPHLGGENEVLPTSTAVSPWPADVGSASSTVTQRISCWAWSRRTRLTSLSGRLVFVGHDHEEEPLPVVRTDELELVVQPALRRRERGVRLDDAQPLQVPLPALRRIPVRRLRVSLDEADEVAVAQGEVPEHADQWSSPPTWFAAAGLGGHAATGVDDEQDRLGPAGDPALDQRAAVSGGRLPVDVARPRRR